MTKAEWHCCIECACLPDCASVGHTELLNTSELLWKKDSGACNIQQPLQIHDAKNIFISPETTSKLQKCDARCALCSRSQAPGQQHISHSLAVNEVLKDLLGYPTKRQNGFPPLLCVCMQRPGTLDFLPRIWDLSSDLSLAWSPRTTGAQDFCMVNLFQFRKKYTVAK